MDGQNKKGQQLPHMIQLLQMGLLMGHHIGDVLG